MAGRNESAGTRRTAMIALLAIALLASAMLVIQHFGAGLPGCGPRSACDDLAATPWGRVPGLGWPIALVGVAWFAGLLAAWATGRGPIPGIVRGLALIGGVFSVVYLVVMLSLGKICPYCLVAHLANLGFVGLLLLASRRTGRARAVSPGRWLGIGGVTFAAVLGALLFVSAGQEQRRMAAAESERERSASEIVERSQSQSTPEELWGEEGFRGRYVHGPESAAIRVVMFTDYQCPDCNRIEREIEPILKQRDDISLSVMHFPFCRNADGGKICNQYAPRDLHANACRAARAAEAAGIVGGNDAFWGMHFWIFSRSGNFTQAELDQQIGAMRLDREDFLAAMQGDQTLSIVHQDVERAHSLGLHYTPMIFINGVELKGWNAANALERTIAQVAATSPDPRTASADHPAPAIEKYVSDWMEQRAIRLPGDIHEIGYGQAAGPEVEVVLWGDYQEENSINLDREIRAAMETQPGIRYIFRHFPVNRDCNPTLPERLPPESVHAQACWAAQLVEAAGYVGGDEAYRRAHQWAMEHQEALASPDVRTAAGALGLDSGELLESMSSERVRQALEDDCQAASRLGVRSIPLVYVNGKFVPRAAREGADVMTQIMRRAAELRGSEGADAGTE
jgi:predicted DsbA family dithiol-disulfide isomerase/uncharacterized membrane protein